MLMIVNKADAQINCSNVIMFLNFLMVTIKDISGWHADLQKKTKFVSHLFGSILLI